MRPLLHEFHIFMKDLNYNFGPHIKKWRMLFGF